jgi:hypothetical protein
MVKFAKKLQVFALIFLLSAFIIAAISPNIASVKAQGQAEIDVLASLGGTTDPAGGSSTKYNDGTDVTLTATAGDGFAFGNWEIVTADGGTVNYDNPATLTVSGGVTYAVQAIFNPVQVPPGGVKVTNVATAAIVVVLPVIGGATSPAAGTYALENAASLSLTAMPATGFQFDHWVIGGSPLTHGAYSFTDTPTNNPYTVDHGYGNTYTYQAVFKPTSTGPTPTIPEIPSAAVGVIALALVAILLVSISYKRKK